MILICWQKACRLSAKAAKPSTLPWYMALPSEAEPRTALHLSPSARSRSKVQDCVELLIRCGLITERLVPVLPGVNGGKYFTMPDEVFHLGL